MSEQFLQVSTQGDVVKFAWMGRVNSVYCVDPKKLQKAGSRVRDVLERIANEYAAGTGSYTPYLRSLARSGEELRTVIFNATDGTSREHLLEDLEPLSPDTQLTIVSDSTVEIPWNFVYAGVQQGELEARGDISDFKDFWLSRFKVRIRFNNANAMPRAPIAQRRVKTLLALHQSRFQSATESLARSRPEVRQKIEKLLRYEVGKTSNWDDCREKWAMIQGNDSILYIFAHRDEDDNLCLEERERISQTEPDKYQLTSAGFAADFKKGNRAAGESNTLCFVNGCRTAEGGWGNSLLTATSGAGFHGFIGSEAEVPSDWATRYAVEFLYALLEEGKSVDTAYEEARTTCFPMSLWYSCYAQPAFQIARE